MSVLQNPNSGVIMLLEYSINGTVLFRWATQEFNDNGYTAAGYRLWEGRILKLDKLSRGVGNMHQLQKAQLRVSLANTDGALTTLIRDINSTAASYYMAQVKLSIFVYQSGPDNFAVNELKTLGIYRVDSIDHSDTRSHLEITLTDKTELVFGYLRTSPTLFQAWTKLVAADSTAALATPLLNDDSMNVSCPYAFGAETAPGIQMTDCGAASNIITAPGSQHLFQIHWLFFIAIAPNSGALVMPTRQLIKDPRAQKEVLSKQVDVSNIAPQGATIKPLITVKLTSITFGAGETGDPNIDGKTFWVCWGYADLLSFLLNVQQFLSGPSVATGQSPTSSQIQMATDAYSKLTMYMQPNIQLGETLSGSNTYGYDGYDVIRSIVDGYTEGAIANVNAASFNAARNTLGKFFLPAGGIIQPQTVLNPNDLPQVSDTYIEQIMQSHNIDVFWSWAGQLNAIQIGNPTSVQDADHTYTDSDVLDWAETTPRPEERGGLCTRIEITGAKAWHDFVPKGKDLSVAANSVLSRAGFAVGTLLETVYGRRITRRVDGSWQLADSLLNHLDSVAAEVVGYEYRRVVFKTGLRALRLEIGEWIRITCRAGLDAGGYTLRLFQVFGLELDHESKTVTVDCLLSDIYDTGIAFKPFLLDDRGSVGGNWIRSNAGGVSIAASSTAVVGIGTTFVADGVAAGDIFVPVEGPNIDNLFQGIGNAPGVGPGIIGIPYSCQKVASVTDATHLTLVASVSNQALGNNTGPGNIGFRIERSDHTQGSRTQYGRLALRSSGNLSSGAAGYRIYR